MIKRNDILYAFTKLLKNKLKGTRFDVPIYLDRSDLDNLDVNNSGFLFVEAFDIASEVASFECNYNSTMVNISYYPSKENGVTRLNECVELIEPMFVRQVKVKDVYIDIEEFDIKISSDDLGRFVVMSVVMGYFDTVVEDEKAEIMDNVRLSYGDTIQYEADVN